MSKAIKTFAALLGAALIGILIAAALPAQAARENDVWVERLGTYIESTWSSGRDVLINGTNKYLNFGSISGSTGYGIRDNAGTIETKNSGGSWTAVGAATINNDSITPDMASSTGQVDEYCLTYEATGDTWEWQGCDAAAGDNITVDTVAVTDPDFASTGDIDFVDTSNTITANINAGAIVNADINASAAIALSKLDLTGYTGATSITTLGTITTGVWQATALTDTYVSDTLTIGSGSTVDDGALSANVSLLGSTIAPTELASADFGDFTCNGTTCSLDTSYQPLDSDLTTIAALTEADSTFIVGTGAGWTTESGATVRTSLGLGSLATLSTITTSEITDDTITHADIADSDQASSMCWYIEDPTAADDLTSLWHNGTGNDYLLTAIWGESDQTVSFDFQVDDGTPADVNGTDISPAAGQAEDTSLSGDTTVAAGEELDLAVTSVSGTPTWVSVCVTGNWVD